MRYQKFTPQRLKTINDNLVCTHTKIFFNPPDKIDIKSAVHSVTKPLLRITFFQPAPSTREVYPGKASSFKDPTAARGNLYKYSKLNTKLMFHISGP